MLSQRSRAYSNHKSQPEIDLEEERQVLLEDQKIIRQRAHKLSVETNRRRKALEERQREEEQKEQKFREDVLQQRKLKLQEATEKFQRAHLPPSQRQRPAYTVHKRPTPKLEDALEQIQGSSPSKYYYLSSHRSPNGTRKTDTPSGLSSIGHSTWPRKQQSAAKLDLERVFQDRPAVQVDSYFQHRLEEAQRLLQEQHLNNLQNFHQEVEQLTREDSLTSLDSLEEHLETIKEENNSVFSSDSLHKALAEISANRGYHNTDGDVSGLNSQTIVREPSHPVPEEMIVEKYFSLGDEGSLPHNGHQQKMVDTLGRNGKIHLISTYNSLVTNEDINQVSRVSITENKLSYYDRDNTTSNVMIRPCKAWATPDSTLGETIQSSLPRDNKDTPQHHGLSTKPAMTQPLATPVVVPFPEGSASSSKYNVSEDLKPSKHSDKIHSVNSVPDPVIFTHTYNTLKNNHSKPLEIDNREIQLHQKKSSPTPSPKPESGLLENPKSHQNGTTLALDVPELALSTLYRIARINSAGKEGKKLLKSILKKGSKYENGYARAVGISKMVLMGDRGSIGIRDSVELIKEKEHKKTNNKKLRWLDEIEKIMDNGEAPGENGTMQAMNKSPVESQTHCKESNQGHKTSQNGHGGHASSVFSTGYHFTKQAWMVSKEEESNSVGHVHKVRSPPKTNTKVVRRPKSARIPSVVLRNRKGIIIRPQSASEASKTARSHGKIMTPRPPPRPASDNNNRELVTKARTPPANTSIAQGNHLNNVVSSTNSLLNKDNVSYQTLPHSSGNMQTTHVPSDADNASKAALTFNSDRVLAIQENFVAPAKRHPVFNEKGLRLDHTPTEEEIALLWQGVRSALTHKNTTAGDFRAGDLPSHLQHTRSNLSHIVIDGATLNNWKSLSRINGFFSPLSNGYVTLARRKQILDSNENKRRALLEQRKGRPVSAGWRPSHTQNVNMMKVNPLPSALEPGQAVSVTHSGEVSESTAQFMLAENLVETSATDGEILAAMQEAQANKHAAAIHKAPHTALSIEEQRLLQSLDRLNQRLQNVQETMVKPSAASNQGFPPKSALKVHQFPPQPAEHMTQAQKYRSLSADPRTRLQRRY
ncbi:centrosomal protein of 126 kDa [Hyla sarda]|uniref:centrosomal protein of 126 kDa n=1 Tax=Hyla sarda TaxID=327740 RepID=UPI0024C3DC8A|nr:centrosomal protein of 126 kDa [Hyla sarda]XP_056417519.1 centrosomal protein of 126 kDa [Hyla sarda]